MKAIRTMGGFPEKDSINYNPRTAIEPSDELQKKIFPWADACYSKVLQQNEIDKKDRVTAVGFFKLLLQSRRIVLQDAAAMLINHPSRCSHPFFSQLPVFKDPLFLVRLNVLFFFYFVRINF